MGRATRINRRTVLGLAAGAAGVGWVGEAAAAESGLAVRNLRVEWLSVPIGIDNLRPRFRWEIAADPAARGVRAKSARVLVARSPEALAARHGDVWDSGALGQDRFTARPPRPLSLQSHTPYYWAVAVIDASGVTRWSEAARFITGLIDPTEWQGQWIAAKPPVPTPPHMRGQSKLISTPEDTRLPLFRKDFALDALPVRAVVSVSGLGHFELTVNGQPVTDSVLNPGWTAYDRTLFYTTYDVQGLLRPGANRLGVRLGNGMYTVEKIPDRKAKFVDSFGRPKLILQLSLFQADGTVTRVVSDTSWETIDGPILYSSIYAGEDVDGRLEPAGWDMPGTKGDGWRPVLVAGPQPGRLRAQTIPPVRLDRRFETVAITEPKPGVFVYDLGENFAGRPEMVVRGPAGATVKLTPCETLGEDGLAWQKSFNAGPPDKWVLYKYTLAGTGDERFVPRFNYHGFRYVQVEGAAPAGKAAPGTPEVVSMAGQFLHTDLPPAGDFDSSDALLVRTHHLIERAVLSNAYSVLTDCPHREKLGWLEQTHLNALTVFYNRDAAAMYEKMIADIRDTQKPDGMVPGIAPEYVAFVDANGDQPARNSPEWGTAVVLSPWAAYRQYGDPQVLADGYAAMQRYLAYLAGRADGHILDFGLGDWYDVGPGKLGASQLTTRALTATAVWYQALTTFAQVAHVLGQPDAAEAEKTAAQVKAAFNGRFLDPQGFYDRNSQTANAMPLALGMVPEAQRAAVLAALVQAVRDSRNSVTAGDVGFHYVVRALSDNGRDDVILDMLSVTDRPSYGYQLAKGATALTESWNADPTKSLNHFMLGHAEGWLFGGLAGIKVDFAAAPERILTVAPKPVGAVAAASATHHSVWGEVRSSWRHQDGAIELDVDIPAGARARVVVPTGQPKTVLENDRPAASAPGILKAKTVTGGLELIAGSGRYRFSAELA
jgi:hypothetical protein